MILVPKNFGIAGSMGILALNCVVGGLIGGVVAIWRMVTVLAEIIKLIRNYFWTRCPKVRGRTVRACIRASHRNTREAVRTED